MSVKISVNFLMKVFRLSEQRCAFPLLKGNIVGQKKPNWHTIQMCFYSSDDTQKRKTSVLSIKSTIPLMDSLNGTQHRIIQNSRQAVNTTGAIVHKKLDGFFVWYDDVTHRTDVLDAHKKLDEIQDKLNRTQNLRREVFMQLNTLNNELQSCYDDLRFCQRGEKRYSELIHKETEIHPKIQQKNEEFKLLDKEEYDLFIQLQAAMRTSHEKEKVHTNSIKYWSLVGTLACALLSIVGTAFSFYNRNSLITDITKLFSEIDIRVKSLDANIQKQDARLILIENEQRNLFNYLQRHDQNKFERIIPKSAASKTNNNPNSGESWINWIGRKTYITSIYRYFVPTYSN